MVKREQISALMDGSINDAHVLNEMDGNAELQNTWARYHLIGDAMRNELSATLPLDFASTIMTALENEPTYESVTPISNKSSTKTNVVQFFRHVGLQLGQYAIAASVAATVIFGVQHYQNQDGLPQTPILKTTPIGGSAAPVSILTTPKQHEEIAGEAISEQQEARIRAYLQDHQLQQRLLQNRQDQ